MEHNTSILSSSAQSGPAIKTQAGLDPAKAQGEAGGVKFGEVMREALQSAQESPPEQVTAFAGLEQQIAELSAETEALLVTAEPEAVEGILSQAVTQLWELIGNFDTQNGTQFVSELSENLTEAVDIQGTTDIAELLSTALIQPANPLIAQSVVSEVPTALGRVEMQSLVFVQGQPQTGDAPLFANITNLLLQSQSLAQNGQNPSTALQVIANASTLEGIELLPKAVSDWPQQIQQFAVETPSKNQALENTVAGQLAAELTNTASKTGADTIQLSGGDAVKAKVKELLAVSAQAIVLSANTPATSGENLGQLLQARTELQNLTTATLPVHTRPARSFSQNVASQMQGKPIGEGITRIELAPRGLGNVIIELQKKETGDIQIIVKAENPAVLHALRTDREMLLSVLSDEVSAQDGVDLQFEEFSEGQFMRDENGVNFGENLAQSELENEEDENSVNPAPIVKQPLGEGQLDILT
ncbi:MAG: hypothetical protein JKX71_03965 [Amylibacter sp.]|nr:hypothetical protein [Amylibacter sp.]